MPEETVTPLAVTPPQSTPATPAMPAAKTYADTREVWNEIMARSGLTAITDVACALRFVWEDPEGRKMIGDMNGVSPFDKDSMVFVLFHSDEEIRVYTCPKEKGELKRYHLSKRGRTFVVERMFDIEQFIDAVAEEFVVVAENGPDLGDEIDRVVDFIKTKPLWASAELSAALLDGRHEEDEGGEGDDATNGAATAAS